MSTNTAATLNNAAALIADVSPFLAAKFRAAPFHRRTVVAALHTKMTADRNPMADKVRAVLTAALDAVRAVEAADER